MTAKLPEYLEEQTRSKIEPTLAMVGENIPGTIQETFLSTPPNVSGPGSFALWVFTDLDVVLVWDPFDRDRVRFDVSHLADCVDWVRCDARQFNGSKPESRSILLVEYSTGDGVSGELWGVGEKSCAHLMEIYKHRFLKNFYPPEANVPEDVREKREADQSAPKPE